MPWGCSSTRRTRDPEGWFAAVGFAAPFLGAGLLAILGALVDAPWHWWAAGIALVPCSIVSIVLVPLLFPAVALIVVGFRNGPNGVGDLWGAGGSSSNILTTTEATLSVTVAVCVLVVGWAIVAAPERRR